MPPVAGIGCTGSTCRTLCASEAVKPGGLYAVDKTTGAGEATEAGGPREADFVAAISIAENELIACGASCGPAQFPYSAPVPCGASETSCSGGCVPGAGGASGRYSLAEMRSSLLADIFLNS